MFLSVYSALRSCGGLGLNICIIFNFSLAVYCPRSSFLFDFMFCHIKMFRASTKSGYLNLAIDLIMGSHVRIIALDGNRF